MISLTTPIHLLEQVEVPAPGTSVWAGNLSLAGPAVAPHAGAALSWRFFDRVRKRLEGVERGCDGWNPCVSAIPTDPSHDKIP